MRELRNDRGSGWGCRVLSASREAEPLKNDALEGLRGIAALGVVFSHLLFSLFPYLANNMVPNSNIPQAFGWESIAIQPIFSVFYNGSFAVSIFFVLSGYVLTKKFYETGDTRVLYSGAVKRYPRLVIPASVSVFFAWTLLSAGAMNNDLIPVLGSAGWPYGQYHEPVSFVEAVRMAFVGAPLLGETALNNPLWTIRIELLGSLFLFAAYAIGGTKRPVVAFLAYLLMVLLTNWANTSIVHFIAIFGGSLLNRPLNLSRISWYLIAAGLIGGGFDYSEFYAWVPVMGGEEKLVMNTLGAVLLVAGVLANPAFAARLASKAPVVLGGVSYSSYLVHWPIICSFSFGTLYVLKLKLGLDHQTAALIVLTSTLAFVLVAAACFERHVDAPATRLASNLARRLMRPAAVAAQAKAVSSALGDDLRELRRGSQGGIWRHPSRESEP